MRIGAREWQIKARALEQQIKRDDKAWLAAALGSLPAKWSDLVRKEHKRRGGLAVSAANAYVTEVTTAARGRLPLSASDEDLRAAAKKAAREAQELIARGGADTPTRHIKAADVLGLKKTLGGGKGEHAAALREKLDALAARFAGGVSVRSIEAMARAKKGGGKGAALAALEALCRRWDIEPAEVGVSCDVLPAIKRMCCSRWWLRRLRRAHGRRCEGAAIKAGVVRRGLWPYSTQDAIERRQAQRKRNARALERAVVECLETAEAMKLEQVVAGSIANPEVKRSELMVRIKGCDAIAAERGAACEFWTLTCPSEYHAMRMAEGGPEANPNYSGKTPKEAQAYLTKVWARARAAWKRRGLEVFGLRTAEPHHDGCPHWHLIAYGSRRDLRFARRLLRVYALRQNHDEPGAREHRFKVLEAKAGTRGAAYAAKYVSKNIDGKGLEGDIDQEGQRKISASVRRVDAWASNWGIRQFQFFGCPSISGWRTLRRMRGPVAVVGSMLERARSAADDADFAGYWSAWVKGGLKLIYRAAEGLTAYGDAAAARIAGVSEGARRALLPEKTWLIHWGGEPKSGGFGVPRSCVNNCTGTENQGLPGLFAWGL